MNATDRALLDLYNERRRHLMIGYDVIHDDNLSYGQMINFANARIGDMLYAGVPITRDNVCKATSILLALMEKMERDRTPDREPTPEHDMIMVFSHNGIEHVDTSQFTSGYDIGNLASDYPECNYFYVKIGSV